MEEEADDCTMNSYRSRYFKATQGIRDNTLELKALLEELLQENAYLRRENLKHKKLVDEANKIFSVMQGWKGLGTKRHQVTNTEEDADTKEDEGSQPDGVANTEIVSPGAQEGTPGKAPYSDEDATDNGTPIFLTPGREQQEQAEAAFYFPVTDEVSSTDEAQPTQKRGNQPTGEGSNQPTEEESNQPTEGKSNNPTEAGNNQPTKTGNNQPTTGRGRETKTGGRRSRSRSEGPLRSGSLRLAKPLRSEDALRNNGSLRSIAT